MGFAAKLHDARDSPGVRDIVWIVMQTDGNRRFHDRTHLRTCHDQWAMAGNMTSPLAERATIKAGKWEWFRRASPRAILGAPGARPGTMYECRVCGPSYGLLTRQGRLGHILRDIRHYGGIKACHAIISARLTRQKSGYYRRKSAYHHEAPQGVAYERT